MATIKKIRKPNADISDLIEKINELIDKINSMEDQFWQMVNDFYEAETENKERDRLQ